MTSRARPEHYFYLSALVALKNTLQLRTAVLSETTLDSVLSEDPVAITFSEPGSLDVEGLLGGFLDSRELFEPIIASGDQRRRWQCYGYEPKTRALEVRELLTSNQLRGKAADIAREVRSDRTRVPICVVIPLVDWTKEHSDAIRDALYAVILKSSTDESLSAAWEEAARSSVEAEASEREMLIRIRGEMLDKVGAYTSEELAAAADSITSNASQFALDQRNTGKIFGVRYGRAWRYPEFQFDSKRRPYPEMKAIIEALPDEQGWDRIQWFLEPHAKLQGRSPLQVWKTDREKVVKVANMERWNARL